MYRVLVSAVFGVVMLFAASVQAREFVFSVESRIGGDSNIFRRHDETVDDGFFEFAPRLIVRERREELNYEFVYSPVYQSFFKTSNIAGWDQGAKGKLEWRMTPIDSIGVTGHFSDNRRVRQNFIDSIVEPEPIVDQNDRERVRRIRTGIFYSRDFTPRLGARVDLSFEDVDFNTKFEVDTRAYSGLLSGSYQFSSQTSFGLSAVGRYRENLGSGLQTSSTSTVGSVAASISHQFLKGLEISIQAGPSIIQTEEDDRGGFRTSLYNFRANRTFDTARAIERGAPVNNNCAVDGLDRFDRCDFVAFLGPRPFDSDQVVSLAAPANGKGLSESNTSFFALARIRKEWRNVTLTFTYTRSESANSGVASSSIVDSVVAHVAFRPGGYWSLWLRGEWDQRDVVADVRRTVILAGEGPAFVTDTSAPGAPSAGSFSFATADSLTTVIVRDANDSASTQWRLTFDVNRKLTSRITLIGQLDYLKRNRRQSGNTSRVESILGYIGLRYTFDPIIF